MNRTRPDLHKKLPGTSPQLIDGLAALIDEYGPAGVAVTLEALHPGIFPLARRLDRRRNRTITPGDRPERSGPAYTAGHALGYAIVALTGIAALLALAALVRISYRWAIG